MKIFSHVLTDLILVTLLSCALLFISFDVLIMTQGVEGCTGESCILFFKGPKSKFREESIVFFSNMLNCVKVKHLYLGIPPSC